MPHPRSWNKKQDEERLLKKKQKEEDGGGGGIRTPAGFDTPIGFRDRPLQPDLGTPPYSGVPKKL